MNIFITQNGRRLGPFSVDDLRGRITRGETSLSDLAWHEGRSDWATINEIPELLELVIPPLPGGSAYETATIQRQPLPETIVPPLLTESTKNHSAGAMPFDQSKVCMQTDNSAEQRSNHMPIWNRPLPLPKYVGKIAKGIGVVLLVYVIIVFLVALWVSYSEQRHRDKTWELLNTPAAP